VFFGWVRLVARHTCLTISILLSVKTSARFCRSVYMLGDTTSSYSYSQYFSCNSHAIVGT
jgi:hypothetical protein